MARAARLYIPASAVALAGMIWRMGWISEHAVRVAGFVVLGIVVTGLVIGATVAFTRFFLLAIWATIRGLLALLGPPPADLRPMRPPQS